MKNILTAVLQKLGKNYEQLSPQAKSTFGRWEEILSSGPITIDSLKRFLLKEKEALIVDIATPQYDYNSKEDMFARARLNDCMIILSLLDSPDQARQQLERYLRKLHKIR